MIETHISWVFLTDRFAYKLKKPVRFEFLDFSTLELREAACREEVRLNRRLAPHVYLGVTPIHQRNGRLRINGEGKTVDWLVKMQRLPAEHALDRVIASESVSRGHVDRIAKILIEFYQQLPPISLRTEDYQDEIQRHVSANEEELCQARHGFDRAVAVRVHQMQRRLLACWPELLSGRVVDGRIVEGHGDLRPEHIYLTPQPSIIDCIEFNADFRTLDIADELCFLTMECAKLGAEWIGQRIFDAYCRQCQDAPAARLVAFYKAYRACVRAKVAVLRADQLEASRREPALAEAERYLNLADRFAREIGPPLLIVVRGRSGTGKSTLAEAVAQRLGVSLLQTDKMRRELLGKNQTPVGYGQGKYNRENRELVYDVLLRRAEDILANGQSAVLDGTFLAASWRARADEIARRHGALPLMVHCTCAERVAKERIAARVRDGATLSEARDDIYAQQARDEEPDPPTLSALTVDTERPLPELVDSVIARIKATSAAGG